MSFRMLLPVAFLLVLVTGLILLVQESGPEFHETADPGAPAGPEVFTDVLKIGQQGPSMVSVPAGSFQMGDLSGTGDKDERPVHRVRIAYPLALSQTEVTVAQFSMFVADSGYQTDAERNFGGRGCVSEAHYGQGDWGWVEGRSWRNPGYPQTPDHPVVCVSWNDAEAYVAWLAKQTGQPYRLPTEAEWEYSARAGTTTRSSAGEHDAGLCSVANIGDMTFERAYGRTPEVGCEDGYARTAPAASFEPNPFGLHDMHGNAWEWVADCWHDTYEQAPQTGQAWLEGGDCSRRVLRGGSWFNESSLVTSSYRDWDFSEDRYDGFGFRVARELKRP